MVEQLLVIGLGIGDDADAAWFTGGLSLDGGGVEPEPGDGTSSVTLALAVRDSVDLSLTVQSSVTLTLTGGS